MGKSPRYTKAQHLARVEALLRVGASAYAEEYDSPMTLLSAREIMLREGTYMLVDHDHECTAILSVEFLEHNRPTDLEKALDDPTAPAPSEG